MTTDKKMFRVPVTLEGSLATLFKKIPSTYNLIELSLVNDSNRNASVKVQKYVGSAWIDVSKVTLVPNCQATLSAVLTETINRIFVQAESGPVTAGPQGEVIGRWIVPAEQSNIPFGERELGCELSCEMSCEDRCETDCQFSCENACMSAGQFSP